MHNIYKGLTYVGLQYYCTRMTTIIIMYDYNHTCVTTIIRRTIITCVCTCVSSPSHQDFHRRVLPTSGLDKVVVEEKLMKTLREIVQFEKARSVLFGQWGFGVSEQQVEMHIHTHTHTHTHTYTHTHTHFT